jgi:hypothetical protein
MIHMRLLMKGCQRSQDLIVAIGFVVAWQGHLDRLIGGFDGEIRMRDVSGRLGFYEFRGGSAKQATQPRRAPSGG